MMKHRNVVALVLLSSLFSGCTSVRIYPICFYDKRPDAEALVRTYIPGLLKSFSAVVTGSPDDIIISPDVRWIIASTTDSQDAKLLKIWPRVACVGPAGSTSEVKLQMDCIAYVEDFIKERKYTELGMYKGAGNNTYYNESRDEGRLVYCAKRD